MNFRSSLYHWVLYSLIAIAVAMAAPLKAAEPLQRSPGQSATQMPDGRWLLLGGSGELASTAKLYDPASGQSVALDAKLATPRAFHTATLLATGRVAIVGGFGENGAVVRSVEMFDPVSLRLSNLADPGLIPRARHSATLLFDGRVLLTGGVSERGHPISESEIWNPTVGHVESSSARMIHPRSGHTAQTLPTPPILIQGGLDASNATPAAELFVPAEQRFIPAGGSEAASKTGSAPAVQETLPEPGADKVEVGVRIAVRFSKPMRMPKLSAQTITLHGVNGTVPVQVVPAENGMLLFVTPRAELTPGVRYTLFIAGAEDSEGLALPFTTLDFTTRALRPEPAQGAIAPPAATTSPSPSSRAAAADTQSSAQSTERASERATEPAGAADGQQGSDSEIWIPGPAQMRGNWRAKRPPSELEQLPALSAPPGIRALAGQVLLLNGAAAENATLRIGTQIVRSGRDGRFLLQDIPAGRQTLVIDGASANRPGKTYGYFETRVSVAENGTTVLSHTIWLSQIDTRHSAKLASPTTAETVVTTPYIPGLELRIPAGTVLRDRAGRVVTEISITPIPIDRAPFPLPTSLVPVYFTIQPGGVHLQGIDAASAKGARLIYPNYRNSPAGAEMRFWNYDPMDKGWYVYGKGRVSADGKQIVPDPGVAIYEFTGAMVSDPDLAPDEGPKDPCSNRGDPVDCSTGLFLHQRTDLVLADVVPIELTRTYRQRDTVSRAFGIGTNFTYGMFMVGSTNPWTYQDLILPDGQRIHFPRISPGTGFGDAVYEATDSPGRFFKARIEVCRVGVCHDLWVLTLKDGTRYFFPEAEGNSILAKAAVTYIEDRNGNVLMLTRDWVTGDLQRITSPNGRWIDFTYDASSRITRATDIMGRVVTYAYDSQGRLTSVTDPEGKVESYTYDASHRMLTVTKPGGQIMVTNVYDANGRVTQQTLTDAGVYAFAYALNASGKVVHTDITDPSNIVERIEFNAQGYIVKQTRAVGRPEQSATVFERNSQSNHITAMVDPLGRRTTYAYDAKGNTTGITRLANSAQASTTTMTYEPVRNQLASVTDPLGRVTLYRYDAKGNLIQVESPAGEITTIAYDAMGRAITVTDPLNNATTLQYDGADLSRIIDPLGRVSAQFTDSAGRVVARVDPLGNIVRAEYDGRNLVTRTVDAAGNAVTMTYDSNRNLTTVVDAKGGTWTYSYDGKDRLTSVTNPLGKVETYAYDPMNNIVRMTGRGGKIATFTYDSLQRRTKAEFGRVMQGTTLTAPDATVTYGYDAASRLTQIADSQGGTISRQFDGLDRLTQESTPKGTVSYGYDAANRRISMTAGSQQPTTYTYAANNTLLSITRGGIQTAFTYDAGARPATLTLPNGIVATYTHDAASQLTGISYKLGNTVIGDLQFEYDAGGRRTDVGGSMARIALPAPMNGASYNAANQVISWAGAAHSYDDDGNLLSDGLRTYTYDSRSRLTSVSGVTSASFSYDGLGRRTDRTVGSVSTGYLYDGLNPVQELVGAAVKADLLSGLGVDQLFARTDAAGTKSLLADPLGSTLALTDASGAIQTSYTYEPYGVVTVSGLATDNAAQFTGRENDDTGLYFYRARYYDPAKGRFTQTDPIGLLGGINTYAYAEASPTNLTDPLGLATYMCTQPLGSSAIGRLVYGPGVNGLYHQYIGVVRPDGSAITGSQNPTGSMFGSPGTQGMRDGTEGSGAECKKVADDNECLEKCLENSFARSRPQYSLIPGLGGQNCQSWANSTLGQCQTQCKR